jgi:hypothetical protein
MLKLYDLTLMFLLLLSVVLVGAAFFSLRSLREIKRVTPFNNGRKA